jgi:hypothetical protein
LSDKEKKSFNYNYPVVVLLYGWALVYLVASRNIEGQGAKAFPYFVIGMAVVLATLLLLKNLLHIGKKEEFDFSGTGDSLKILGLLIVYAIAVTYAGFYLPTPFFLYLGMLVLGQRNHKIMILCAILVPLFAYGLFDLILGLRMPSGAWF